MDDHWGKGLPSYKTFLENIFDSLPALVYCKDSEDRIVYVNEAFATKFEMDRGDFEGKKAKDIAAKTAGHLMRNDRDILKSGTPQKKMYFSYETPAGNRWAHVYKSPFLNTEGKIIGVIGFATDVTEIKRMQDELKRNEERFRNFFETSRDCIYMTSVEGKILEFNDAAVETFGYESKEAFRLVSVQDLYKDPEDRDKLRQKVARDGLADKFPVDLKRKDGQVIHSLVTAMPVKDDNGRICAYQGTVHDVTALKKAEAQKNLLEAELRQAQKMEAIAKLSGGISHDFNNLLFTIMGSIELAQSCAEGSQAKQLNRAYRACLEAKQLIRQFLELSESSPAGQASGSIAELVQKAVGARIALSNQIHYEIQISSGLYRVAFVYDQLLKAIENLLSNAENALPEGGTITVCAKNADLERGMLNLQKSLAPGKYLKISVSDNGVGIPEDKIEKIFDPYFSTYNNPSSKGHGLGLTTVYATIKRHKGGITVDSAPGEGTAVSLYLPAI